MRYFLRKPTGRHKTFRITLVRESHSETIQDPTLQAINDSYASTLVSKADAEKSLKALIVELNKRIGIKELIFSRENQTIVESYWIKVYSRKKLVDRASAKSQLFRAITALGELSLLSATQDQLQDKIDALPPDKQRRQAQSLNQLLKFLNRDFTIHLARPTKPRVKFLTEEEFTKILNHLPDEPTRLLHQAAFYTGARIGELFALNANCILQDTVRINTQEDRKGVHRDTKNLKDRFAYVDEKSIPILKRWILTKAGVDRAARLRMSKITRRACIMAKLPSDKWCTFHDLRHSYAIGLVSKGVSITAVAQCLGNGVSVCERYYVGFQLTSETVQMIKAILKK